MLRVIKMLTESGTIYFSEINVMGESSFVMASSKLNESPVWSV